MRKNKLPALLQDQRVSAYCLEISKYPMLSPEEEYMLAKRASDHQDINAAQKLVTSHLRLVVKLAMNMRGYGIALMDLISEGNIGLLHAVKKFNPDLGHRFATYAMWWVKATIGEFIMKSWSLVKIGTTNAQRKLFYSLNNAKKKLESFSSGNSRSLSTEDIKSIASDTNVKNSEVKEMENRMVLREVSLDDSLDQDSSEGNSLLDTLSDTKADFESDFAESSELEHRRKIFGKAFSALSERERHIIESRYLSEDSVTLNDLSEQYKVSRERIRQIEERAFEKLQSMCLAAA